MVLRLAVRPETACMHDPSATILDSQTGRTVEVGLDPEYDIGKQAASRTRHPLVDTLGCVVLVLVTAAPVEDRDGAEMVLHQIYRQPWWRRLRVIWADAGYRVSCVAWVAHAFG